MEKTGIAKTKPFVKLKIYVDSKISDTVEDPEKKKQSYHTNQVTGQEESALFVERP